MSPKIVLVANCQARPISTMLCKHYNAVIDDPIIVHLAKDEDAKKYLSILHSADYIVSQNISNTYGCQFVRTESIQEQFKNKTILIPNLYYRGYNPDLRYVRLKGTGTLGGPLGDYHSQIIFSTWYRNGTPTEALECYNSTQYWEDNFSNVAVNSLEELRTREKALDIKIANFIKRRQTNKQLFYTYNHPSKVLLLKLVKRIAKRLELKPKGTVDETNREPLGRFRAPIHPFIHHQLGLKFKSSDQYQGNHPEKPLTKIEYYTPEQMINAFFEFYELHETEIKNHAVNIANN